MGALVVGFVSGSLPLFASAQEVVAHPDATAVAETPASDQATPRPDALPATTVLAAPAMPTPEEARPEEKKPQLGYDDGYFMGTEDEKFKLRIGGQVQARMEYMGTEVVNDEGDFDRVDALAFSIPRARLKLDGNVFTKALRFQLMADFGKGSVVLKDSWIDAELVAKWLVLRVGQTKRPFSRQQLTSSSRYEMVDAAITDKAFGAGYDIGFMFHNNFTKSPKFEWALGLFNGTGDKPWFEGEVEGVIVTDDAGSETVEGTVSQKAKFNNVPAKFRPTMVARVGYNYGGIKGYSEADLEGGPLRFGVGASGQADFNADEADKGAVKAEVDVILKVYGLSLSGAGYLATTQDATKSWSSQSLAALGAHAQLGYVIQGVVQPVVRYALVDPTSDFAASYQYTRQQEWLGGLAVYFFKHNAKWQTEGGVNLRHAADEDETALNDIVFRTQFQLAF